MQTPYQGDANYYGYETMSNEEVAACIRKSPLEHQQLLVYCDGDAATKQYLTRFERTVRKLDAEDALRLVMIHTQLVQKEQLERMKPLQMIPSFFATHIWHWGNIHIENFGVQRASLISPLRGALQLGLAFILHTDTPVIAPNLMESIWCAAVRRTKDGAFPGERGRINVYEALRAITQYVARQYHEEGQKRTLEADKLADFAVLDQDPLEIPVEEIRNIQVLKTWKEGTCMYKRQTQKPQST